MPCRCGDSRCNCTLKCICYNQNCPCMTCEIFRINENWSDQPRVPTNRSRPQKGDASGNLSAPTCSFSAATLQGNEKFSSKQMPRETQALSYFRIADVNIRTSTLNTSQPAGAGNETILSPSCSGFQKNTESHASQSSSSNTNLPRNTGILEPNKGDGGQLRKLFERGNPTKEKFEAAFKELERKEKVRASASNIASRVPKKVSIFNPSTSQSSASTICPFDSEMLSASHEQRQMNIPASKFLKRQSFPEPPQEYPLNLSKDASVESNLEPHPSFRNQNVTRTLSDSNLYETRSGKPMPLSGHKESYSLLKKLLSSSPKSSQEFYQESCVNPSPSGSTSSATHSSRVITEATINQPTGQSTVEKIFSELNMSSSTGQRTRSEPNLMRKPSQESFSQSFENELLNSESTSPKRKQSLSEKNPRLLKLLSEEPYKASNVSASYPTHNVARNASNQSTSQSTDENKFLKSNMSLSTQQGISSRSESTPSIPSSEILSQSLENEPLRNTKETSPEQNLQLICPLLSDLLNSPPRNKQSNVFTSPSKNYSSNSEQIPKKTSILKKCLSSPPGTVLSSTSAYSQSSSNPATVSAPLHCQERQIPRHDLLTRSESEPSTSRKLLTSSMKELERLKNTFTSSDYDCANPRAGYSAGSLSVASSQASTSSFSAVSSPGRSFLSSVSASRSPNHPQIGRSISLDSSTVSENMMRPPPSPARLPAVGQELSPTQFQHLTTTSPVRRPHLRRSSCTGEESPESPRSISHKRKKSE